MSTTAASEKMALNEFPKPARPTNCYDTSIYVAKEKEGGLVDKLVNRVLDKYEKLPATVKDQINLEQVLAKDRKRYVEESQGTTSRGLQQPPKEKHERFKVRTVLAEEVLQDEDNKSKNK